MMTPSEVEAGLRKLTARQCKVLYYMCRRMQIKEMAKGFKKSQQTIHGDISAIYEVFGLKSISDFEERRQMLYHTVCPVQYFLVANPDVDCVDHLFQQGDTLPPDPRTVALVVSDLDRGLLSLSESQTEQKQRGTGGQMGTQQGNVTVIPPGGPNPRNRFWWLPWALFGVAFLLILCSLFVFLNRGSNPSPQGGAAGPQVVVVTSPPIVITSPPIVVTQPPVVVRQPPAAVTQSQGVPSAEAPAGTEPEMVPTAAKPVQTAITGTANLAGRVKSDIPGTKIALDATVSSVVDSKTKPDDVYAIDLVVGETVRFEVTILTECLRLRILNPDSSSIEPNRSSEALTEYRCSYSSPLRADFTPAVSGTYYMQIMSRGSGQRYSVNVTKLP